MFENLSERLDRSFKLLKGEGKITEINVAETLKDVRKALLDADVNYKVAKGFTDTVKAKALGQNVLTSVKPSQLMVKIVHDELADLMGGTATDLDLKGSPAIILMSGLQGSGKTTFSGKLANLLKTKKNKKPLSAACYVYRPAAIEQLRVVGEQVGVPVYMELEDKNPVELARMQEIFLKDSVAVTKFIYWLKTHVGKEKITEVTAADYLEQKRREIPEFLDLSFPTIAGYKSNAAMMHYEATPDNCATLEPEGMLLVDSGGQYLGGTTDVTRTIVLGPISEEIKKHYTMVAAAVMQLTHAHWLYGCTGRNLDILARQPIWDMDIDYQCGTGHGVGYILNVHEGPQNMRWRFTGGMVEAVFEDGMDITNEPGIYIQGSRGIRIENVMVAKNDVKNEYGQFMHFETLTWVPIDREAIDEKYLNDTQKKYLHEYQKTVYEKISPYLNEEEKEWLAKETRVK